MGEEKSESVARLAPWKEQVANSTVLERARQIEAVRQLRSGQIKVPLRCGFCRNTTLTEKQSMFVCVACGRPTPVKTAHRLRQQEISAIIADGVDLDVIHTNRKEK